MFHGTQNNNGMRIIGNKQTFAVQVEILKFEPWVWGKSAIWVGGEILGDYDDENIMGPFIGTLMDIALHSDKYWDEELKGLDDKDIFYTIHPFYNNPDGFYDLSDEEAKKYYKYDKYLMGWGENFDDYTISIVDKKELCLFIWVYTPNRDDDNFEVRNNIKSFEVPLLEIQEVYRQFCTLIPNEYWPKRLVKLER